jgi:tRNA G18 (ribose-2'-O)-methylase SpoU
MPTRAEAIVDPADPRIAAFRGVGDPALVREQGCFVAEGRLIVRRAIGDGRLRVRSLLVAARVLDTMSAVLQALPADAAVYVAGADVVRGVTGFNIHRGCLALVERPAPLDWRALVGDASAPATLVVLEAVANPDNIGGVFRNAAAFGATAVLLDPACSDPLYRKAIRTSMGAALAVPFATVAPWPGALAELRSLGWTVAALTGRGDQALAEFAARQDGLAKTALLLGHEGEGLSHAALAAADVTVRIPMAPGIDSLNVATAAAVALFAGRSSSQSSPSHGR